MGILLEWARPSTESTYDTVYIYRSTTESGTYTELANQAITDNTYFDIDGSDSSWYKIRFELAGTYSAYSTAMKGNTFTTYCQVNDIRTLTHLNTTDITDASLYDIIKLAMAQLNADINVKITREYIEYIDDTRQNKIDGSNTTYYIKNWSGKYLADSDNDGDVDTSDITVYAVASDGTETEATVSTITPNDGKFVLSTAYDSSYKLYVTYEWAYASEYTPDTLVRLACANLAASYAFAKINIGKAPTVQFGNVRVYRHMDSFKEFEKKYRDIVNQINTQMIDWAESESV